MNTTGFKIGDTVKVVNYSSDEYSRIGTVERFVGTTVFVRFPLPLGYVRGFDPVCLRTL